MYDSSSVAPAALFGRREKLYEEKLRQQKQELKQLHEERQRLMEIQGKIQDLQWACPDLQVWKTNGQILFSVVAVTLSMFHHYQWCLFILPTVGR